MIPGFPKLLTHTERRDFPWCASVIALGNPSAAPKRTVSYNEQSGWRTELARVG